MHILSSNITIGKNTFDFVNEITINDSWNNLTNTCEIIIPKKLTLNDKPITAGDSSIFNVGDKVSVKLGYDGILNEVFSGFITFVDPSLPINIKCEDMMWVFKSVTLNKSFPSITLSDLVDYLLGEVSASKYFPEDGIEVGEIPSIDLGKFTIKNATAAQVFDYLRKDYGIISFFRNGKLWCGLTYYPNEKKELAFNFERDIIEHDLIYKKEEDLKIKLKVISIISATNKKYEYETGAGDGEQRTMYVYNMPESSLKTIGDNELSKYVYTGFEGSFVSFGTPYCRQGDSVVLTSTKIPEKNGTYYIKEVQTTFGMNGFRQQITIDQKIK